MSCMVSYIEWHKHDDNGEDIDDNATMTMNFLMLSGTLQLLRKGTDPGDPYSISIEKVDHDHIGLSSCVAGNILGETVETAFLQINTGKITSLDLYLTLLGLLISRILQQ